jgi:hypothetical protein
MHDGIRERVEALRREIAEIQQHNLAYLEKQRPDSGARYDHIRRARRLREILDELKTMTDRKRP